MNEPLQGLSDRLHGAVALFSLWLVLTSPWIAMARRIPTDAAWLDYAHVALGLATLLLGVAYAWSCLREGRWRLYFPLTPAQLGNVGRELGGLMRGRVPGAEGGGLFGFIEGLLLVALLLTAATGAAWLLTQGSAEALGWREAHLLSARGFIGLLVLHVVTVSLHLLEFVRD